jgi:aromatic ring-opening dioxygenase LigB subunit
VIQAGEKRARLFTMTHAKLDINLKKVFAEKTQRSLEEVERDVFLVLVGDSFHSKIQHWWQGTMGSSGLGVER